MDQLAPSFYHVYFRSMPAYDYIQWVSLKFIWLEIYSPIESAFFYFDQITSGIMQYISIAQLRI